MKLYYIYQMLLLLSPLKILMTYFIYLVVELVMKISLLLFLIDGGKLFSKLPIHHLIGMANLMEKYAHKVYILTNWDTKMQMQLFMNYMVTYLLFISLIIILLKFYVIQKFLKVKCLSINYLSCFHRLQ